MVEYRSTMRKAMRTPLPLIILASSLILILHTAAGGDDAGSLRTRILDTARQHIGDRYHYGGMSTKGFDCSGFVQFVYRENGITLPRSTVDQFEQGKKIGLEEAKPGDLVFFKIYRNRISHVGIFISTSRFIHAPSYGKRVGIADMNLDYWKRTFVGAVTYIDK